MVLRVSTLTPSALLNLVDVEGEDRIRTAIAAGHGAIVFSGHFGYWELHGLVHALVLAPMSVLARPLDNPHLHALLERMRRATGNPTCRRASFISASATFTVRIRLSISTICSMRARTGTGRSSARG